MPHFHNCADCGSSIPNLSGERLTAESCSVCLFLAEKAMGPEWVACNSCQAKRDASWPAAKRALDEMRAELEETRAEFGLALPIQ